MIELRMKLLCARNSQSDFFYAINKEHNNKKETFKNLKCLEIMREEGNKILIK